MNHTFLGHGCHTGIARFPDGVGHCIRHRSGLVGAVGLRRQRNGLTFEDTQRVAGKADAAHRVHNTQRAGDVMVIGDRSNHHGLRAEFMNRDSTGRLVFAGTGHRCDVRCVADPFHRIASLCRVQHRVESDRFTRGAGNARLVEPDIRGVIAHGIPGGLQTRGRCVDHRLVGSGRILQNSRCSVIRRLQRRGIDKLIPLILRRNLIVDRLQVRHVRSRRRDGRAERNRQHGHRGKQHQRAQGERQNSFLHTQNLFLRKVVFRWMLRLFCGQYTNDSI